MFNFSMLCCVTSYGRFRDEHGCYRYVPMLYLVSVFSHTIFLLLSFRVEFLIPPRFVGGGRFVMRIGMS